MPRLPRLLLDDGCYHVLTRGNNRATVFHDQADFQRYAQLLREYVTAHDLRLYHYCFMSNHVHLVVEVAQGRVLSKAMHGLNLSYALAYRKRYGHTGHFWQDRFKSLLIAKDSYLLQCGAYVELNPVRAKMVPVPEAYPWSSYRVYAFGQDDPLVTPNPIYQTLAATSVRRQVRYRQFIHDQVTPLPPNWLGDSAIGSTRYLQDLANQVGHPLGRRARGRPRRTAQGLVATHEK